MCLMPLNWKQKWLSSFYVMCTLQFLKNKNKLFDNNNMGTTKKSTM